MKASRATFFILLFFTLLTSCTIKDADIQPNLHTAISGQFYDNFNKEIYAGVKIKISAIQTSYELFSIDPVRSNFVGYIDSTISDANGNYKISFTTSGNASEYYMEVSGLPYNINTIPSLPLKIDSLGKARNYNFNILKHYYLQIRVVVHDNPYPPLSVYTASIPYVTGNPSFAIHGINNDTIENIPIQKNFGSFLLYFTIQNPSTGVYLANPPIPLNPIITSDTTKGETYDLYPATFK